MRPVFLILLCAAALIRILFLGSNPAGVFRDEAEKGYSAFCLIKVGGVLDFTPPPAVRDPQYRPPESTDAPETSPAYPYAPRFRPSPLFIHVWGTTTSMIYQYAALPFIAAGGLHAWSVRLPSALAGALTVLLAFFLARALLGRDAEAFWAAAFLAFSPWHVVFSRWALQGIFVPLFLTAGTAAFLKSLDAAKPQRRLWLCAVCFGLAFYSYAGARPFLLLFWIAMAAIWRRTLAERWKIALGPLCLFLLLLAPTLRAMFGAEAAGLYRFQHLSVFGLDEPLLFRIFLFVKNYLAHFSPQFLFLSGDALPRHGFPGFGVLLHAEAIPLMVGLYTAFRRRTPADCLLLAWFLLFPVSAALTHEGIPHALRTLHAVPCPQILSAMGAVRILEFLEQKWGKNARRAAVGLWILNAALFAAILFLVYPRWSAPAFEYGVREAIRTAWPEENQPDETMPGNLHVVAGGALTGVYDLYCFHMKAPPAAILKEGFPGTQIRIYPFFARPETVLVGLRGRDCLIIASEHYFPYWAETVRGSDWEARPILLPRALFSDEPSEILRLIVRKPKESGTMPKEKNQPAEE